MCAFVSFYVTETSVQRCARGPSPRSTQSRRVETAAFSKAGTGDISSHRPASASNGTPSSEHPFWKTTRAWQSRVSTIISSFSTMSTMKNHFQFGNFGSLVQYSSFRKISVSARSSATLSHPTAVQERKEDTPNLKAQKKGSTSAPSESKPKPAGRGPTLKAFLKRADYLEVQYTSMLADLSNMAYEVGRINPDLLKEDHNLTVVATSNSCPLGFSRVAQADVETSSPTQVLPADVHAHFPTLTTRHADHNASLRDTVLVGLDAAHQNPNALLSLSLNSSAIDPAASLMALSHLPETGPAIPMVLPVEYINHPKEFAEAIHCPVASLATLKEQEWLNEYLLSQTPLPPFQQDFRQMGLYGNQTDPANITGHEGLATSGASHTEEAYTCVMNPESLTDWFACDDPVTQTRYFCIKGSDSMEHWQINLRFDPVAFEDPELGINIHNGVYDAALKLYDDLLPLVRQHIATSPFATVCFTGHSLGGSLASVLMLLLVHRGVLPPEAMSPCYTFGAPAVFCGGAPDGTYDAGDDESATGILSRLGLTEDHLVSVIMHKDICPRAFVCDYTLVADLLKVWMPSFKDHSTFKNNKNKFKPLYNFIGRVAVLRPDDNAPFVNGDAHHDMLPSTPGLYKMVDPAQNPTSKGSRTATAASLLSPHDGVSSRHFASGVATSGVSEIDVYALSHEFTITPDGSLSPPRSRRTSVSGSYAPGGSSSGSMLTPLTAQAAVDADHSAPNMALGDALLQFMNNPHPLAMLRNSRSYGHNGAISRYHNPESYMTGLVRVAQLKSSGLQSLTSSQEDL